MWHCTWVWATIWVFFKILVVLSFQLLTSSLFEWMLTLHTEERVKYTDKKWWIIYWCLIKLNYYEKALKSIRAHLVAPSRFTIIGNFSNGDLYGRFSVTLTVAFTQNDESALYSHCQSICFTCLDPTNGCSWLYLLLMLLEHQALMGSFQSTCPLNLTLPLTLFSAWCVGPF